MGTGLAGAFASCPPCPPLPPTRTPDPHTSRPTPTPAPLCPLYPSPTLQAFIKAVGLGLEFELGRAEFTLSGSSASVAVEGVPQPLWAFRLHELGKGHWVSVARGPLEAVVDRWGVGRLLPVPLLLVLLLRCPYPGSCW